MYMYGIAVPLSWARVLSSSEAIFQMEITDTALCNQQLTA